MGTQSPGSMERTKHMLSEALIQLVSKRSFKKVSVGDICTEAGISRSAFYNHFEDKYALLSYSLSETLRLQADARRNLTLEEQFVFLLQGVQENRRTIHNIFAADLSLELIDIFQKTLTEATIERLYSGQTGESNPEEGKFVAAFLAGGLANVIISWVRENCATPIETVAAGQSGLLEKLLTPR